LINSLSVEVEVTVFTALPESFFREELQRPFRRIECEIDCGCLQPDSIDVDVLGTLQTYASITADRDGIIAHWSQLLRKLKVDLVIGDIPPLAFPIARATGLPSYSIGNFTWTDIYAPYVAMHPEYQGLLAGMRADYACATAHLRLEPYHGEAPGGASHSVGLLARTGQAKRAFLAGQFGLNADAHWALIYIGSHGLPGIAWQQLEQYDEWQFLGLYDLPGASPNYRRVEKRPDLAYADLTASCQVILGKLGYGLVGEAMAHAIPIIFPGRRNFSEYEFLKQVVEEKGLGRELDLTDLREMRLQSYLDWALQVELDPETPVAIPQILKHLGF
jgi:hypothetical protein